MKYRTLFVFLAASLLFFPICQKAQGQEEFRNLVVNPKIKSFLKKNPQALYAKPSANDTLELPFFDDFSDSYLYPDSQRWSDNDAYINPYFGVQPPSLGVATLDAIAADGSLHPNAVLNYPFVGDFLTSKPLNLSAPNNVNVFLSFFYQPGGLADVPEAEDSLVLEFYSPQTEKWQPIWKAKVYNADTIVEYFHETEATEYWVPDTLLTDTFRQVIIPIANIDFLQKGFRFGFKNFVTITDMQPGRRTNGDIWNIDYIYLNANRDANDTQTRDIAFVYPMKPLLSEFEAVPWQHYKNHITAVGYKENLTVDFKNNDYIARQIDRLDFEFIDHQGSGGTALLEAGSYDIPANTFVENFEVPHGGYFFNSNATDSALFEIKASITTDDFDSTCNNTVSYFQKFYDYYAYDDGSAELGYGITGEGAKYAMVAYQFSILEQDTLQAVKMYFNQTLDEVNSQYYFYLNVWEDDQGQPGNLIYSQKGERPEFAEELNQYVTYKIDTPFVVPQKFYVGFQQTRDELINLGYDLHRNARPHIFYNFDGLWRNSWREGALMIRPIVGSLQLHAAVEQLPQTRAQIFPNPTPGTFFVRTHNNSEKLALAVFNQVGKCVKRIDNYRPGEKIDISAFDNGFYFVKIATPGSLPVSKKIILAR